MALFVDLKGLLKIKKTVSRCMVVSEQEGAEIWANGKKTAQRTPALVTLPQNREVLIELRHPGHEAHRVFVKSSQPQSFYYCDLKRIPLRLIKDEEELSEITPAKYAPTDYSAPHGARL